jgi:hypothetical protein
MNKPSSKALYQDNRDHRYITDCFPASGEPNYDWGLGIEDWELKIPGSLLRGK